MLKINGNIEQVLYNVIAESHGKTEEDFNGRIIITDLDLNFLTGFRIENGYLTSRYERQDNILKCESDFWFGDDLGCNQSLDGVTIVVPKKYPSISYIYSWSSWSNSDDNPNDEQNYYYGGGGGGGGCSYYNPEAEEAEDNIDDTGLNKRARCLFAKLKSNKLFKNTIGVFDNNDNFELIIKDGFCGTGIDGCTNGGDIENGNVLIKIQSFGNYSLDLASTMLHEGIHAEIYKYVYEFNEGIDPNERRNLLNYYYYYGARNGLDVGTTRAQHQFMADNYVKPIAQAIRELDGSRYPLDNYMGFGWDGLRAYGYNGYYDRGVYKTLDKSSDTEYYKNQAEILATTIFGKDCLEKP